MFKKLLSHSLIYGLSPQLTKIASFFALPLITSELTDLDFGVSGTIAAYVGAISVLSTLGLRVIFVNTFYKSPGQYKWAWRQLFGFLNLWNILYSVLVAALIYLIIPVEADHNKWLIIFLNTAPLVLFGQTATIGQSYYQLKQKPAPIAIRNTLFGFLTVGLNVLFIAHYKMGYLGWFWAGFIVSLCSNLSYAIPVFFQFRIRPIYNFKWRFIKNSLKVSVPLIPHYYSVYLLSSSDKVIMNMLKVPTPDVGKYTASDTLGNVMSSANSATGSALGPLITQSFKNKNFKEARNLIFFLQTIILLVAIFIGLWMKEVFAYLIRNETLASMYYLGIILIMSQTYRPMYLGFSSKYMYFEKTKSLFKITFIAGILNIVLNLILIPIFGFEVAAITTFIGYMYMGYAGYLFKGFRQNNEENYYPLYWLIVTVLMTVLVYFAVELDLLYKVIISLIGGSLLGILILKNYKKFI